MHPKLHRLLALGIALALLLPALLTGAGSALADAPEPVIVSDQLLSTAGPLSADEEITVGIELAGNPVVKTYLAMKDQGANKADAAKAQQARKADLEKTQSSVVAAIKAKVPSARILTQHQLLVNAVTARVKRGDVAALSSIPGVTRITRLTAYKPDLSNSVPYIHADQVMQQLGIYGRGVKVAIIDSGIDYTHAAFGGPGTVAAYEAANQDRTALSESVTITDTNGMAIQTKMFPTAKIEGGYDFVGENWASDGDPLEPDPDPLDDADVGHGTHVASTVAGFGVPNASFNGSMPADNTFAGTTVYHGVAPAAILYAYRVCNGSCPNEASIQAMERSMDPNNDGDMSDHLDAINMSLGRNFGDDTLSAVAASNAVDAGVAMALSAGNSGDVPFITGATSVNPKALSVANMQGAGQVNYLLVATAPSSLAGRKFLMAEQDWAPPLSSTGPISGDLVYIGRACPGDALEANPAGKIALIVRGTCAVSLKAATASAAGALAAMIYNNQPGELPTGFSYGGGDVTIPTLTITLSAGTLLRNTPGVQVTLSTANVLSMAGTIASGSSRGPSIELAGLKPDVSAPGTNIVAAGSGTGNGPKTLSGTSMASPHVAGVLALLKQAHPTWTAIEREAAIANTANPIIQDLLGLDDAGNPRLTPVSLSRQGSGLVDAFKAVSTTTVATVPDHVASLSYGILAVTDTMSQTKSFTLTNKGTTQRTYTLSTMPFGALPAGTTMSVSPASVTLAPGASATVNVTLNVAAAGLPAFNLIGTGTAAPRSLNSAEISGFVKVSEEGGAGDTVSVPVYALARKAAAVTASANSVSLSGFGMDQKAALTLANTSANPTTAEVFSLMGVDANEPANQGHYNSSHVGVRSGTLTNSQNQTRQVLQFAVKTYGTQTVSAASEFDIHLDVNGDGNDDYIVFNADVGGMTANAANYGVNATFISNRATGRTSGPYFATSFRAGGSTSILTVYASDVGLTDTNQKFDFYVLAFPYYQDVPGTYDVAPDGENDVYMFDARNPRFMISDADGSLNVPANGSVSLDVYANARGYLGGEMTDHHRESGLMIVYGDNVSPSRDADPVTITFPFNFSVSQQTFEFDPAVTGYFVNRLGGLDRQLGTGDLWTGVDNRALNPTRYIGVAQFGLGAVGSTVEFEEVSLELTGRDTTYLDPKLESQWMVDILPSSLDTMLGHATFNAVANATPDATLSPVLTDADLGAGKPNTWTLDAAARRALENHVRTSGKVTFRTWAMPMYSQGVQLFSWDGRASAAKPVLRALTVTHLP